MSEVWGTSGLSPVNNNVFNWKIDNFDRLLKIFGKDGFDSPSFFVSCDGRKHSLKFKLIQQSQNKGYDITAIKENGYVRSLDNFVLVELRVVGAISDLLLAGTVEFELDGINFLGGLGNPDKDEFTKNRVFDNVNKSSLTVSNSRSDSTFYPTNSFCMNVDNAPPILHMKVQLATPGVMTHSISTVPNEHPLPPIKEVGTTRLLADIKSLLNRADDYADFSILCEGQNFPCHEAILRVRSPVLDKMFLQKMKESTTRKLIIEDVKKGTIDLLLEYLYTGDITKTVENDSELIYVADKYEIRGLLELCFRKLPEVDDKMVVDILIIADRHNLGDFKKVAMQRILKNKAKFLKDKDFVTKINQTPSILMDFFQL